MSFNIADMDEGNHPTRWQEFDKNMPHVQPSFYGFTGFIGDINRWEARYRAAASFNGIDLLNYTSAGVINGYSALVRSTLVWSAFERYLPLVGLEQRTCNTLLTPFSPDSVISDIKAIDLNDSLYRRIRADSSNSILQTELDKFLKGETCNVTYLLSVIRHKFAHGHLTPSSSDDASITTEICTALCDFHLRVMDEDFSNHVEEYERMINSQ